MELITGCSNLTELRRLDAVFESFRTIHISEEASRQALHWMKAYRLSHGLTIPDALIAATAQISGLSLYTKNTKHFQMIPLLQIIRPY